MPKKNEVVKEDTGAKQIAIAAPNFRSVVFSIEGTAPLVMNKFSQKAKQIMMGNMSGETKVKTGGKKRDPKNWDETYEGAIHYSANNEWVGFPASAFRAAAISACRIVGFKMTLAKLGIFVRADGYDADDGSPLIRLYGEPHPVDHVVRLATGVASVTRRPMFDQWTAKVIVDYDADMFSVTDLYNLFMRVGLQVGIGEGRPDSKSSAGMGWGTFRISEAKELR